MKVLVINPPNNPETEKSILMEPIDALTAATWAKQLGHDVKFIDMDAQGLSSSSAEQYLAAYKPDHVLMHYDYHIPLHNVDTIENIAGIAHMSNAYDARVIVAGKTPKHYPSHFLGRGADVVINGEVEPALNTLLERTAWDDRFLATVPGISYLADGHITTAAASSKQFDLDQLISADHSMVNLDDYIEVRPLWTSRGCAHGHGGCSFCATPPFWGPWRGRSAQKVLDDIGHLIQNHDAKKIILIDDNATTDKERMRDICDGIIERDYDVLLGCLSRVADFDPALVDRMAQAGFRWIHYGAESGNDNVLRAIHKGTCKEKIREAILGTKRAGIRVRTSWIMDLPGMDEDAVKETVTFIGEIAPHEIRIHYLAVRPDSPIEKYAHRHGTSKVPAQYSEKPTPYIHNTRPDAGLSICPPDRIVMHVDELTESLMQCGYHSIQDVSQWGTIDAAVLNDPDTCFIALGPARYGVGW